MGRSFASTVSTVAVADSVIGLAIFLQLFEFETFSMIISILSMPIELILFRSFLESRKIPLFCLHFVRDRFNQDDMMGRSFASLVSMVVDAYYTIGVKIFLRSEKNRTHSRELGGIKNGSVIEAKDQAVDVDSDVPNELAVMAHYRASDYMKSQHEINEVVRLMTMDYWLAV
ncbi:hypothetical protein CR513_24967, partial [Mucuna pruriens]